MFVVTGTPRSATGYASLLWQALNVPCSHERIFRPRATLADVLEWCAAAGDSGESSWLAWVFLDFVPGVPVLHTVRDPYKVVESLAFRNDLLQKDARLDKGKMLLRKCAEAFSPTSFTWDNDVDRAVDFVLVWNHNIETTVAERGNPYLRYRVEDMGPELIGRMLDFVGIYRDSYEIEQAIASVPHNVNGGKRIEHNIPIKNELVLAHLSEVMPDMEQPSISRAYTSDRSRSRAEIESTMDADLVVRLRAHAERYGYSQEEQGETHHVIGKHGATV